MMFRDLEVRVVMWKDGSVESESEVKINLEMSF